MGWEAWDLTPDPARRLYQNNKEQYYQPGQRERQHANDERKKCIQPDGFKYANPTHKQCGTGDYFGAFTKWDYKEPFNPVKTGDPVRAAHEENSTPAPTHTPTTLAMCASRVCRCKSPGMLAAPTSLQHVARCALRV